MKNKDMIIKSAIASVLTLTATGTIVYATNAMSASVKQESGTEKCYGIVKKGMNDCQTANSSCASSSKVDNQPDAFVFVPKGLCDKIVGGSTAPKKEVKKS